MLSRRTFAELVAGAVALSMVSVAVMLAVLGWTRPTPAPSQSLQTLGQAAIEELRFELGIFGLKATVQANAVTLDRDGTPVVNLTYRLPSQGAAHPGTGQQANVRVEYGWHAVRPLRLYNHGGP